LKKEPKNEAFYSKNYLSVCILIGSLLGECFSLMSALNGSEK